AARREISDCSIVPSVGAWIVAPGLVRGGIAAARVDVAPEGRCHKAMVGKWIVCSHGPAICRNSVNLNVEICADGTSGDAVDFAVKIGGGMKVRRDSIRGQARVIRIANRI